MSGNEASKILKQHEHCGQCYLTRYRKKKKQYTLTVFRRSGEKNLFNFHIKMIVKDDMSVLFKVVGGTEQFTSISELLNHYQNSPINAELFEGIGECATRRRLDDSEVAEPIPQPPSKPYIDNNSKQKPVSIKKLEGNCNI